LTPSLRTSVWVWACLGCFLLSRVPAIRCPYQLDVDEGQMLAQAMRYEHDLTPWRAVDGETGGPLLSWVPLFAHDIGLPYNFRTLHLLAALILAGTLLAAYAAARELAGEEAALVALAAGAWWLALTPGPDFVHYSSELIPGLLLALALVAGTGRAPRGIGRILLAGLLLGLIPWAKLQAVPIGLALGGWMLVSLGWEGRWRQAGVLLAGAVLPSAALLAWIRGAGAWDQFWHSYIVANLYRAAGKPWSAQLALFAHRLVSEEGSAWFLSAALLVATALGFRKWAGGRRLAPKIWILALLLVAAAIFAVLRPTTQYPHYEQLCLVPLLLLVACAASILVGEGPAAGHRRPPAAWWLLALGVLPLPAVYFVRDEGFRVLGETWAYQRSRAFETQAFVESTVRHFVPQPQSLAVWGWAPYLYVDLGIPPGTRDAGYTSLHDGNPSQEFMRAAFLRDLTASAPQTIVDTEDYIVDQVRTTAPASFPGLAALLRAHYVLIGRGTATLGPKFSILVDVYLRRPSPASP
jgi:uncharacterized membrane protein